MTSPAPEGNPKPETRNPKEEILSGQARDSERKTSSFEFRSRFPVSGAVIGALAVQTLRQCLRRRVLWVLVLFVATLFIGASILPSHDPVRYVGAVIEMTLTAASFFGILVAVFLAATVLPEDRAKKTISTLMTKPVGRLNYLLGRVAGFAATLGIILLVMGAAGLGFIRRAGAWAEGRTGRDDLLVGKRGVEPAEIFWDEGGGRTTRLPDLSKGSVLARGVGQALVYAFRPAPGVLPAGEQRLDLLPSIATGAKLPRTPATVIVENPIVEKLKPRRSQRFEVTLDSERLTTVKFPASLVHPTEGVVVRLQRHEPGTWVRFAPGTFQVMTRPVPFEWAYLKSLVMVFMGFLLVIVVSVTASTFLSAWVAVLLAFTAYFFALLQDVLVDFMRELMSGRAGVLGTRIYEHVHGAVEHPPDAWYVTALNNVYYGMIWVLTHIFPDFRHFDATSFLTAARDVPVSAVAFAAGVVLAYGACYLALAQLVFRQRELMP